MFEYLQMIYFQVKRLIKYIADKISIKSEEPYYTHLPEEDMQSIFL